MQRRFNICAVFIATFLVTGCATYRPKPLLPDKAAEAFGSRRLGVPALEKFMGRIPDVWDLDSLTLAALYYQPDLDIARAQWQGAQAARRTAGERPNPSLSLGPTWVSNPDAGLSPWILGFSFDIPFETAGKRGSRIRQADALAEAARQNLAQAAWQIRSRVRASLTAYMAAQESARILRHQEEAVEANSKLLAERSARGEASPLNAAQAEVLTGRTRLALADAMRQESDAKSALADAIGVPVAALTAVRLSTRSPANIAHADEAILGEARRAALLGRPDLLSALASYAASEAALQLEVAKQYPDVHLGPGFTYDQGQDKWGLGVTFPLPILSQNKGPIAEAKAHREEAAARFLALQDKVINELDRALAAYHTAYKKLQAADRALAAQTKQERALQDLLRPGDVSRLTLLRSRLDLDSTALARADAWRQAQEALGALEDSLERPLTGARNLPASAIESAHWGQSP